MRARRRSSFWINFLSIPSISYRTALPTGITHLGIFTCKASSLAGRQLLGIIVVGVHIYSLCRPSDRLRRLLWSPAPDDISDCFYTSRGCLARGCNQEDVDRGGDGADMAGSAEGREERYVFGVAGVGEVVDFSRVEVVED